MLNASGGAGFWSANNFSILKNAGKQVVVDIGGDSTACKGAQHNSTCAMWEMRDKLAADIIVFAKRYSISGFTLDWEFGQSFDWLSFNRTWAYVSVKLAEERPPIPIEVCINSVVQNKAWAPGGDPSGNTYFRRYPWASKLTDMGSYSLCRNNKCTDAERNYNLTTNLERYTKANTSGWAGGLEGVSTNLIKLSDVRTDQLSPGLWFNDVCTPTGKLNADGAAETSTMGWTAVALRAFLASSYDVGARSVDIWCGVGVGLPMPCPTCPWVFDELRRFQALGGPNNNPRPLQ
jgi:hypothetical protein